MCESFGITHNRTWPFIYVGRGGRLYPLRVETITNLVSNTTPNSNWAFQTGLRTGLTALDPSDRSDRGADLPDGITFSSGLQIGRSIYAFRLFRWDLRNGVVQLEIWQLCLDRSDRFMRLVWPVHPDCPAKLDFANFGCQQLNMEFLMPTTSCTSWSNF